MSSSSTPPPHSSSLPPQPPLPPATPTPSVSAATVAATPSPQQAPGGPKRGGSALKPLPRQSSSSSPLGGVGAGVHSPAGGGGGAHTLVPSSSPLRTSEIAPAVPRRKKARKVPEKQLFPDRVAALLPESTLYTQLLDLESRVDDALARKKTDIQEALKNPPRLQRTLRIYVFNTFQGQNQSQSQTQGQGQGQGTESTWTLRIGGRILEEAELGAGAGAAGGKANPTSSSLPKFSSFFRRITVQLDPSLYPENHTIVWDGARAPPSHVECFEIKRRGEREFTATVRLELNYVPEKYKLSAALTEVLGVEVDTRARIVAALWQYVKARKLQSASDPSLIECDPPLQKIFGEEKLKFSAISPKLNQHLSPPQPIHLEHRIKLSGNSPAGNACYDVSVDVPLPLQKEMSAFLTNIEKHKDIDHYNEVICNAVRKIQEHRRRRAFFLGFSQSPLEFINTLIASQARDLKIVAGEAGRNAERERRSDFYNQPWVEDSVLRYLNRHPAAGADAPGAS